MTKHDVIMVGGGHNGLTCAAYLARAGKKGIWRLVKRSHLDHTHDFFEKYGAIAIVIGRFVPIVRTFAPFLAGVGAMTYRRLLSYNVIGGAVWVTSLVYAGYLFGNIPWVKENLTVIVLVIVGVSLLPIVVQWLRERRQGQGQADDGPRPPS